MRSVALATAVLLCACEGPIKVSTAEEFVSTPPDYRADGSPEGLEVGIAPETEQPALVGVEALTISEILRRRRPELSDAEHRDRLWDLDHVPQEDAEATALIRIWTSEIEMSNEADMIGIWQVVQAVRWRTCDNTRFGSSVTKRITQCRTEEGELVSPRFNGTIENARETYLSAMLRLSQRALGAVPARTARGRWIREVTLDCEEPESWNRDRPWSQVMQPRCEEYVSLARGLLAGTTQRRLSDATILAWGGRCEKHCDDPTDPSTCRQTGACDDGIACRRRLARIESDTANAFWCRPGTRGCPATIDPICSAFGVRVETVEDPSEGESSSETDLTDEVPLA